MPASCRGEGARRHPDVLQQAIYPESPPPIPPPAALGEVLEELRGKGVTINDAME
jgi:hypothetical protein